MAGITSRISIRCANATLGADDPARILILRRTVRVRRRISPSFLASRIPCLRALLVNFLWFSDNLGKLLQVSPWRYGATVSTRPFQGRNTGSIPVSATNSRCFAFSLAPPLAPCYFALLRTITPRILPRWRKRSLDLSGSRPQRARQPSECGDPVVGMAFRFSARGTCEIFQRRDRS
jgi:hypothetical protein